MLERGIRDSAKDSLPKLEGELPRESYKVAIERGQELELEGVIAELVGQTQRA